MDIYSMSPWSIYWYWYVIVRVFLVFNHHKPTKINKIYRMTIRLDDGLVSSILLFNTRWWLISINSTEITRTILSETCQPPPQFYYHYYYLFFIFFWGGFSAYSYRNYWFYDISTRNLAPFQKLYDNFLVENRCLVGVRREEFVRFLCSFSITGKYQKQMPEKWEYSPKSGFCYFWYCSESVKNNRWVLKYSPKTYFSTSNRGYFSTEILRFFFFFIRIRIF